MYLVFGTAKCIYCKYSVMLLNQKGIKYSYYSIDTPLYNKFKKKVPRSYKYVPQIFHINNKNIKFIGGFVELKRHIGIPVKKTKKNLKAFSGNCSPKHTKNKKNFDTCYDKKALIEIIKDYNSQNPDNKIKYSSKESIKSLLGKIDNVFKEKCSNEMCWAQNNNMMQKEYFRPKKPISWNHNPNEWLNTNDIKNVLEQYEKSNPEFKLLGVVPIDFNSRIAPGLCVDNVMCNFDIKYYNKSGISKFGAVLNLDKHDQPGSHWVSIFIDSEKKHFYYFDSLCSKCPNEIMEFYNTINLNLKSPSKYTFFKNQKRHQYKNSECGVYCIHFISKMIHNMSFDDYDGTVNYDDTMFNNRKVFFSDI